MTSIVERWAVILIGSSNLSVPEVWLFSRREDADRAIANPKGEARGWKVLHGPERLSWNLPSRYEHEVADCSPGP